MADWTQLPNELLHLFSKCLHSPFDVIRFRSVCSTWRSTVSSPERHRIAPRFRSSPTDGRKFVFSSDYILSKHTVFLIVSSETNTQTDPATSWVIKIMHVHVPSHRIRFLNPLLKSHYDFRPYIFPKGFNSLDFRVLQLDEEYALDYSNHRTMFLDTDMDMKKVALSFLDSNGNDFVLLSINGCGDLAMFKSSDKKWTNIENEEGTLFGYDDVILYKGKFYAVSTTGRTVVVGLDSEISEVGKPVSGRKKMFLVESKGELLLVVIYPSLEFEEASSLAWTGRFRVYKLDEAGKKWIEVNNSDNYVLFMGINSAFAASAEDLSVCRGNNIVFFNIFKPSGDRGVCVFDLENDSVGPLSKFP